MRQKLLIGGARVDLLADGLPLPVYMRVTEWYEAWSRTIGLPGANEMVLSVSPRGRPPRINLDRRDLDVREGDFLAALWVHLEWET
jgi:hypothetical protein